MFEPMSDLLNSLILFIIYVLFNDFFIMLSDV